MKTTRIREGENLAMLSARLGVPGCMILRANGLFSEAWLLPGRLIEAPEKGYCAQAETPCPVRALGEEAMPVRPGDAWTLTRAEEAVSLARRLNRPAGSLRLLLPLPERLPEGAEVFAPRGG